jgi:hypothetical protein
MTDAPAQSPDVPRLVADVLESDDRLRDEAEDAELDSGELAELLSRRLHEPDTQGSLELRTRRDGARREYEAAQAAYETRRPPPLWLRRTQAAWVALAVLTVVALAIVDYVLDVTLSGAVLLGWLGVMAAGYWLRRLGADRYRAYVQDLLHAQATAAEALGRVQDELDRDLVEAWVKPAIRDEVNRRAGSKYRTVMEPVEYQGLAGDDPRHTIATDARSRLERFLQHKRYGSIGLSGPRGAGKTSLIRAECPDGDVAAEELFGVIVSAPVEFQAREFVLHLFGRLCAAVLGREGVERVRRPPSPVGRGLRLPQALLAASVLALLAAAGIVLVAEELVSEQHAWAGVIAATGVLALATVVVQERVARLAGRRPTSSAFSDELQQDAGDRLRDIWFQQSFTTGWSGAVKLPVGVEGGVEGSQELSRLQMSLPDVVGEIEHLVAAIVAEGRRVRIGIDELDKLADTDKARHFLNEMKVLFGIPECFWLVSISEDAMSSFERRGLPLRDEFDSSFTNVIRVSPQTAEGTIELLRRRLVGVPQPFMLLCHCLAGGLPRDVLRVAWDVVTYTQTNGTSHLDRMCAELVGDHVTKKIDATLVATHRLEQTPPVHELQAWLLDVRLRPKDSPTLVQLCREASRRLESVFRTGDGAEPALELLAYLLFAATCQELFEVPIGELEEERWHDFRADSERLGTAQQAFSVHPRAAWLATNDVRRAHKYDEVPYPELPPAKKPAPLRA